MHRPHLGDHVAHNHNQVLVRNGGGALLNLSNLVVGARKLRNIVQVENTVILSNFEPGGCFHARVELAPPHLVEEVRGGWVGKEILGLPVCGGVLEELHELRRADGVGGNAGDGKR